MKQLLVVFFSSVILSYGQVNYLEVKEKVNPVGYITPAFVCLEVTDMTDATNKLLQVVADYFAGLEYKAIFHEHYHGPNIKKPCIATPLKSSGLSKYVEVYTEVDQYHLPEIVRVACTDAADAEEKAKEIKKKDYFKDKQTKTKVKVKL